MAVEAAAAEILVAMAMAMTTVAVSVAAESTMAAAATATAGAADNIQLIEAAKEMAAGVSVVAIMAGTATRTAAVVTTKATVMATIAASWMPWLKFVHVGRTLTRGWRLVTNLGGDLQKGGSLGQKC